jgi:hypothetical protein
VLGALLGSSGEVVQVSEDDCSQIMKDVCHRALESCAGVFEAEGHDTVCKRTPRGNECGFVLIGWVNLNLVIARESVHERKGLVTGTVIDDLIDERCWKVVFGTCVIKIAKVSANANGALFFVDRYRVGNPQSVSDGVNELGRAQFVDFGFDSRGFGWV